VNTFESIFTNENAVQTAQIVIDSIDKKDTQVDFEFVFRQGKCISDDINTWIKFDTDQYPLLKDMLDVLTNEEIEPTEERIKIFTNFRDKVCETLANELRTVLRDKLRNCVFGGKTNKVICPMKNIKVSNFDIENVPESGRYLLVVKKESPKDEIPQPVTNEIFEYLRSIENEEEGINIEEMINKMNDFIEERKSVGDEKFKYVKGAEMKRAFFECQVDVFADYSIIIPGEEAIT